MLAAEQAPVCIVYREDLKLAAPLKLLKQLKDCLLNSRINCSLDIRRARRARSLVWIFLFIIKRSSTVSRRSNCGLP